MSAMRAGRQSVLTGSVDKDNEMVGYKTVLLRISGTRIACSSLCCGLLMCVLVVFFICLSLHEGINHDMNEWAVETSPVSTKRKVSFQPKVFMHEWRPFPPIFTYLDAHNRENRNFTFGWKDTVDICGYRGLADRCAARWYSGEDSPVCVCNCTYCDQVEPIGNVDGATVVIYTTSKEGKRLERSETKKGILSSLPNCTILIDPTTTFQTINGFGGTMTDTAAYNIRRLKDVSCSSSSTLKDSLMKAYFSSDGGVAYNLLRVPIGSNDGSSRLYTYADTPDDFDLDHFSLQPEDIELKIPAIREAQDISNNTLRIIAASWSAPAWMKRCNCLNDSSTSVSGLPHERTLRGYPSRSGDQNGKYYRTWANYLVSHNVQWQAQVYTSRMERNFVRYNLGPAISQAGLETKLYIFDDNRYSWFPLWVAHVCRDKGAGRYVAGMAVHWFADPYFPPHLLDAALASCGGVDLLYTEAHGYFGNEEQPSRIPSLGRWRMAPDHAKAIISVLKHGSSGWINWVLAADTNGGPQWFGRVDSAVIVNGSAGEFFKQPLFYALGHFSKFVPRGSKKIALKFKEITCDPPAVAFLRPDGLKVIVAVNEYVEHMRMATALLHSPVLPFSHDNDLVASVGLAAQQLPGEVISLNIPANSIVTAVFR